MPKREEIEFDGVRERKVQRPVRYTFAVQGSVKVPTVHGTQFRLGDSVSTSVGPCKVIEVFWRTASDARVLLRKEQ